MEPSLKLINELSELCGIVPDYWDVFGTNHVTPIETKRAILRAMNVAVDSVEGLQREINERKGRPWNRLLEPVKVMSAKEQPFFLPIYLPLKEGEEDGLSLTWSLAGERGRKERFSLSGDSLELKDQRWIEGMRYVRIDLVDRCERDIGYYTVAVTCRHREKVFPGRRSTLKGTCRIIITPEGCYLPPELEKRKIWGLSLNLYSIRSSRNMGVGDFGDLRGIIRWVGSMGGGFVGVNPLHATANSYPCEISPYSPVSRLYENPIYLDVGTIPDVVGSAQAQALVRSGAFTREVKRLRNAPLIDYEKVALLKETVLRRAFETFYKRHYRKDSTRGIQFKEFVSREGDTLDAFSLFLALKGHLKGAGSADSWREWPVEFRQPGNPAVQKLRRALDKEMLYHKYIQWLITGQLDEVAREAVSSGMPLGLYADLAVGSIAGGSDTWNFQSVIAEEINVGAPPDEFNRTGQDWGFPPTIPEAMKETGYEYFIQTIRKNMHYSRALRIDHALGLFRLFWVPWGMSPAEGAYVACPSEDLLRIIALESVRNRTMVIAEDLGTIGENARETLQRFQMLSYRLLYFERNYPDPSFTPPDRYPEIALCAVTTHDLPTCTGFWTGRDIVEKKRLGIYPNQGLLQRHSAERERDRALIIAALKAQGILPKDFPSDPEEVPHMTPDLCLAIHEYLALTPCKLMSLSLDDLLGTLDQQNMPGTIDTYPCWRQKTPITLERMLSDKRFSRLSEMLRRHRR